MQLGKFALSSFAGALAAFGLASCGGGGGGGGPQTGITTPTPPTTPTTPTVFSPSLVGWVGIAPRSSVAVPAQTREYAVTSDSSGARTVGVAFANGDSGAIEGIDATRALSQLEIRTQGPGISLSSSNGDRVEAFSNIYASFQSADGDKRIVARTTSGQSQFSYHSFGFWETGLKSASGTIGAITAGESTRGDLVPTTGVRLFGGETVGVYVDPAGRETMVTATTTVMVNFATRSGTFSTHDTRALANPSVPIASAGPLEMRGQFDFLQGRNIVSGFAETTDNRLLGLLTGQFFGPSAQELGGTFGLAPRSGDGRERIIGAFGTRGQ